MQLIALLISILLPTSDHDATALVRTAPAYLTVEIAREHVTVARAAAAVYDVDADLLLSIAHHESRYQHAAVSSEAGDRVSCGVMTPEPVATCPKVMTILGGYLEGARHLRGWLTACGENERCALFGYAGGYRLLAMCREGGPRCYAPAVFLARARWIARERRLRSPPSV
jgi:hypothetical protein